MRVGGDPCFPYLPLILLAHFGGTQGTEILWGLHTKSHGFTLPNNALSPAYAKKAFKTRGHKPRISFPSIALRDAAPC